MQVLLGEMLHFSGEKNEVFAWSTPKAAPQNSKIVLPQSVYDKDVHPSAAVQDLFFSAVS